MKGVIGLVIMLVALLVACAPASAPSPARTPSGPAVATPTQPATIVTPGDGTSAGRALFAAKGCATCHGAAAQGGIGPNLKEPKRTADAITSRVRSGGEVMPAFTPAQVSDAELQNIVAFLQAP